MICAAGLSGTAETASTKVGEPSEKCLGLWRNDTFQLKGSIEV